ncbi:hypothetical protein [Spiroplasma citri]|uniref:hypothetical protein n=1 Tax=Spiroplasma citri TaxID=2133 RepID=UPI0012D7DED7|nr:hypothetical protein [Spiroplasma citri]
MGVGSSTKSHWNDEIIAIREDKKEIINKLKKQYFKFRNFKTNPRIKRRNIRINKRN